MDEAVDAETGSARERCAAFVHGYVRLATQDAELYDLMFSRTIWKQHAPTDALRTTAHDSFRRLLEMVRQWQADGIMSDRFDPKRLSQVTWSTLHGLSRLQNDGVYKDQSGLKAMCDWRRCGATTRFASGTFSPTPRNPHRRARGIPIAACGSPH